MLFDTENDDDIVTSVAWMKNGCNSSLNNGLASSQVLAIGTSSK
jgi:hypothetical protein